MKKKIRYLKIILKIYFPGRSRHNVVLPKIDNGRNHLAPMKRQSSIKDRKSTSRKAKTGHRKSNQVKTKAFYDPTTPLTLQLKHGGQMHQGGSQVKYRSSKYLIFFFHFSFLTKLE